VAGWLAFYNAKRSRRCVDLILDALSEAEPRFSEVDPQVTV